MTESDILYFEQTVYAVVLTRTDGKRFYAVQSNGAGLFDRRKQAIAFRDELAQQGCDKGRVVKVRVRIDPVGKE